MRLPWQIVPAGVSPRVLCAVVADPWSLSDLETTRGICGLEPAPILCTPIKVSKTLIWRILTVGTVAHLADPRVAHTRQPPLLPGSDAAYCRHIFFFSSKPHVGRRLKVGAAHHLNRISGD